MPELVSCAVAATFAVTQISKRFVEGDHITVDVDGETFSFRKEAPEAVAS